MKHLKYINAYNLQLDTEQKIQELQQLLNKQKELVKN